MGLKGDLDEVAKVWRTTPWRVRLWLALSLFLASGSIASLSETVSKWKGFLLDSVQFYQRWISTPLQDLLRTISPVQLPDDIADPVVLLTLIIGASARVALYRGADFRVRCLAPTGVAAGVAGMASAMAQLPNDNSTRAFLAVLIFCALLLSVAHAMLGGAARILWFVYLLGPFALVGLASAVNAGLSR